MKKKDMLLIFTIIIAFSIVLLFLSIYFVKIDFITTVTEVIDGDTFDTTIGEKIRLADIDAPDSYDNFTGYEKAREYLKSLIENKLAYLDVDDYGSTTYGRIVCVVYFRVNTTHLLNVNKELLNLGYAKIWDHTNNEFDPYSWNEFIYYPDNIENIIQLITNEKIRLLLEVFIFLVIISIIQISRKMKISL